MVKGVRLGLGVAGWTEIKSIGHQLAVCPGIKDCIGYTQVHRSAT